MILVSSHGTCLIFYFCGFHFHSVHSLNAMLKLFYYNHRKREGVLLIIWSMFRDEAEQVTSFPQPILAFSIQYLFQVYSSFSIFASDLLKYLIFILPCLRYVYKVCPFKQATQDEGHSSTRLGYVQYCKVVPLNWFVHYNYLNVVFRAQLLSHDVTSYFSFSYHII